MIKLPFLLFFTFSIIAMTSVEAVFTPEPAQYEICGERSKCLRKTSPDESVRKTVRAYCKTLMAGAFAGVENCVQAKRKCRVRAVPQRRGEDKIVKDCKIVKRNGFQCSCPWCYQIILGKYNFFFIFWELTEQAFFLIVLTLLVKWVLVFVL